MNNSPLYEVTVAPVDPAGLPLFTEPKPNAPRRGRTRSTFSLDGPADLRSRLDRSSWVFVRRLCPLVGRVGMGWIGRWWRRCGRGRRSG